MNRNVIKIIACITMLLDHVGLFLMNNFWPFRLIGRLAFPIFAYLIADGLKYTHSRKKYVLSIFIFAVISQIPNAFLCKFYELNILFTYLVSILIITIIENRKKLKIFTIPLITLILLALALVEKLGVINYGIFGVLLVVAFYFSRNKLEKLFWGFIILTVFGLENIILGHFAILSFIQLFAILSLVILYFYNGRLGKLKLKWLMYLFYPLHLTVILLISLLI